MNKSTFFIFGILGISLFFYACSEKKSKSDPIKKTKEVLMPDHKISYGTILAKLQPELITEEEFDNFKNKSNYIQVIEAYDAKNPGKLFGGKKGAAKVKYYNLQTEANAIEYSSSAFIFGDLNGDGNRDCIVSAFRSDGYNEVAFFYVFINNGNTFKLENVSNEDEICECKGQMWPNTFRNQKIENGYLTGIAKIHFNDAHCCPSLYYQIKINFTDGKFQLQSAEFIKDDAIEYRPTPGIDSIFVKTNS